MIRDAEPILGEMKRSGLYRVIVWAGGYPWSRSTAFSDIDLYAVSSRKLKHHWVMERVGNRRIELTAFPLDEWRQVLFSPGPHPKHHYSFIHGTVLHDPENLLSELRRSAEHSISSFIASDEQIELSRYGVAIQIDKLQGYVEKQDVLQTRFHAVGAIHAICDLLSRLWLGYSLEGARNLDTVLAHPKCPTSLASDLRTILTGSSTEQMVTCALSALATTLELTGGAVTTFRGGIPR